MLDYLIVAPTVTKVLVGNAGVVELVDTQDLKSCALLSVWVQVPSLVRLKPLKKGLFSFIEFGYNIGTTIIRFALI